MDFDTWINAAWNDHANDPAGVAARLEPDGAGRAADDAAVARLARLAHHLHGDHLGTVADGQALLQRLAAHAAAGPSTRADTQVYAASLSLTGGDTTALAPLDAATRIRVMALAAANLAERDAPRAGRLLAEAVAAAEAAALPDSDAAVRALAIAGNNIAAALEESPALDAAGNALMLQAAHVGLAFWRRAGTWLEEERAHYRLAVCAATAGDAPLALQHAQACVAIVQREGDDALEAFFAFEALARAEAAGGHADGHARALARQREAFGRLDDGDRGWCRATLEQVESLTPAAMPSTPAAY